MMKFLRFLIAMALIAGFFFVRDNASAAEKEIAIGGYDPVAYFTESAAQKGSKNWRAEWENGIYYFASAENKETFLANPQKYAAQYGGWCAYAMAQGYVAEVDPVSGWSIRKDKLYLNWSATVKGWWSLRASSFIKSADKNWPRVQSALNSSSPPDISRK